MTLKPVRQRMRLTPEERAGMRDFLTVLEAHRDESREGASFRFDWPLSWGHEEAA